MAEINQTFHCSVITSCCVSASVSTQAAAPASNDADLSAEISALVKTIGDHNVAEIIPVDGSITEASKQLEFCQV
jgi:hypothetical protein